uniref:CRISPR-associated endoribonuclease n=1 Tax=candidate division WOR-3 bacterium TaxID=2052148 RepID=A0A7C3J6Y4_UNCW3
MRVRLKFISDKNNITLPVHYNYLLQGFIYDHLSDFLRDKIHNEGYNFEKKIFRFFTFSKIFGKFDIVENNIIFNREIYFWISSPINDILNSFASHLIKQKNLKIGSEYLNLVSIEVPLEKKIKEDFNIKTLSPITTYTTLYGLNNKKKTYFYSPFEKEFSDFLEKNIKDKYFAFYGQKGEENADDLKFEIKPLYVSKRNEHVIIYKKTVIKAWSGIYTIKGSPSLLKLAYEAGIGSKNSQGFGMIEEYEDNNE